MPDCFISYCSTDSDFAQLVHDELESRGMTVFMARISLRPGDDWAARVWDNLKASDWVLFLASRAACGSAYVQQEIGGAIGGDKRLIPVVWDMDPAELPGWVPSKHALDIRGLSLEEIRLRIASLAETYHTDQQRGVFVMLALIAALLLLGAKKA